MGCWLFSSGTVLVKFLEPFLRDLFQMLLRKKSILAGFAILAVILLAVSAGYAVNWIFLDQQGSAYPGSNQVTSSRVTKFSPYLHFREKKYFITDDFFPVVYRWYQNRYGMYPTNSSDQNNCISLEAKSSRMWIERVLRVQVCNTVNGNLIDFERTVTVRFR